MVVVLLRLLGLLADVELDHLWLLWLFVEELAGIVLPAQGDHIQHILAKEQEVVPQGDQREQVGSRKRRAENAQQNDHQVKQRQHPGLDRDDKEQKETGIREEGGVSQEEAHVQIIHIGAAIEDHRVYIHQHHAGEIENIEFQRSPHAFHGVAQRIVTKQGNGHQQNVAGQVGQRIGEQPPYLPLKDQPPVEGQQIVKRIIPCHHADHIHDRVANADIEHQVGDALVSVPQAEPLKVSAQIFQKDQLLKLLCVYFTSSGEKSPYRICEQCGNVFAPT